MIKNRIKKLRKENDLSQRALAKKLNLSPSTIAMYETGDRKPDSDTLQKIANYFNVSVDYLLGNTDERSPAHKIKQALSNDPALLKFWDELKEREDLQLMFKQTKDLPPETIKQIIEIIKTFEKEQDEKYNKS